MAVAAELRGWITSGERGPGDALPSEEELAEEFGHSRPIIREALRILEHEGLIEMKRGLRGGPRVREFSVSEVARPIGVFLQIGDVPVADVWTARERIVRQAVERLASTSGIDLAPLADKVNVLHDHVGDLSSFYIDMIEVAEVAVQLAGNATETLIVGALRHVIEEELAAATAAACSLDSAVAYERSITDAWSRTLTAIRRGQPRAAVTAYDEHGVALRAYFDRKTSMVVHAVTPGAADEAPGRNVMARLMAASKR